MKIRTKALVKVIVKVLLPDRRDGPDSRTGQEAGLTLLEALVAMLVLGLSVGLFLKLYNGSWNTFKVSSTLMQASQIMERHVESIRIHIASNPSANWPPRDTLWTEAGITLSRQVRPATSPRSGSNLPEVRQVDLTALWGTLFTDTLKVTTYVSKHF